MVFINRLCVVNCWIIVLYACVYKKIQYYGMHLNECKNDMMTVWYLKVGELFTFLLLGLILLVIIEVLFKFYNVHEKRNAMKMILATQNINWSTITGGNLCECLCWRTEKYLLKGKADVGSHSIPKIPWCGLPIATKFQFSLCYAIFSTPYHSYQLVLSWIYPDSQGSGNVSLLWHIPRPLHA